MLSLLQQYEGNPDYRIFLIELPNLNLDIEVDDTGKPVDNVIQKMLRSVNTEIYQAELKENKVDLKFVLHQSSAVVGDLEKSINDLGNSVGVESYDLSRTQIVEL